MKTLEEVLRIKSEVEGELLRRPGVTGVDAGYRLVEGKPSDELVIRVYVADEASARKHLRLPTEIQGVPVDVVQRRFDLH